MKKPGYSFIGNYSILEEGRPKIAVHPKSIATGRTKILSKLTIATIALLPSIDNTFGATFRTLHC